jgi:hypothetical protein
MNLRIKGICDYTKVFIKNYTKEHMYKKSVVLLVEAGVVLILCWYGGRDNTPQTNTSCAPSYTPSLPPDAEGMLLQEAQQQVSFIIGTPEYVPFGFYYALCSGVRCYQVCSGSNIQT